MPLKFFLGMTKHPAVFLDRDRTLIDGVSYIKQSLGVAPLTVLSQENAALSAAKIPGLSNPEIQK